MYSALLIRMIFVEHYPSFSWGSGLEVQRERGRLFVGGYPPWWAAMRKGVYSSWDLFQEHRSARRTGKSSPHIRFANADTDEKLIAFVKQFGPVVARSIRETHGGEGAPPTIVAEQDMDELCNERAVYHSALALLCELRKEKKADATEIGKYVSTIYDKVSVWPQQWQRERGLRKSEGTEPAWEFGESALERMTAYVVEAAREPVSGAGESLFLPDRMLPESMREDHPIEIKLPAEVLPPDPIQAGHQVLCELVNAFRPWVYRWGSRAIDGPNLDRRYGIRPYLYHILRQEYLGRGGIGICANTNCKGLFEIERSGQQFCSAECSQHQRQRDYWSRPGGGKKKRRKRLQKKATSKTARKGR